MQTAPLPDDLRHRLRVVLAERDLKLIDVSRETGIAYDRLVKLTAGHRRARPGEMEEIARAIVRLSKSPQ